MPDIRILDRDFNEIIIPYIRWLELVPEPLGVSRDSEKIGDVEITISEQRMPRNLRARILVPYKNPIYKKLIRSELFDLFDKSRKYYVTDIGAGSKVWDVRIDEIIIKRINSINDEWILNLYSPLPYAMSRGTTLDDFTYSSELWSYGMGLVYDEGKQDYIHNTESFSIYNAGNQIIDPRAFDLVIKIKSLGGTASTMTLTNLTTGDVWSYNGGLSASQEIVLDGVKMKKNAANIVGDTNFGLITLKPGMNQFTLTGITGAFEVSFEFRYLYA